MPTEKKRERLYTHEEAALYMRLKEQTLYNWRFYGRGPDYVKMGRRVMYEISELDRFIDAHRVKLSK